MYIRTLIAVVQNLPVFRLLFSKRTYRISRILENTCAPKLIIGGGISTKIEFKTKPYVILDQYYFGGIFVTFVACLIIYRRTEALAASEWALDIKTVCLRDILNIVNF